MIRTEQVRVELERKALPLLIENGYTLSKPVGSGGYGSCYIVRDRLGKIMVCKIMALTSDKKSKIEELKKSFTREFKSLTELSHPHIIKLRKCFYSNDAMLLLVDFCKKGSLQNELDQNQILSEKRIFQTVKSISSAMLYVHSFGVCHHDLKPDNFFIDEADNIILADFGLADFYQNGEKCREKRGTYAFVSPEIFSQEEYDPFKADVWAFGVSLYYITYGYLPFGKEPITVREKQKEHFVLPRRPVNRYFERIILECLQREPRKRPTFEEIYFYITHGNPEASIRLKRSYSTLTKIKGNEKGFRNALIFKTAVNNSWPRVHH